MDIRSEYFRGRQISLLVSVHGYLEGKAFTFLLPDVHVRLMLSEKSPVACGAR